MGKKKGDVGKTSLGERGLNSLPMNSIRATKKARKSAIIDLDYETLDLFQIMAAAAVDGHIPIERIIDLCYSYGVEHGRIVASNVAKPDRPPYQHVDYDETGSNSLTTLEELSCNGDLSNHTTPGKIGKNGNLHFKEPQPEKPSAVSKHNHPAPSSSSSAPSSSYVSISSAAFQDYKGVQILIKEGKTRLSDQIIEAPRYQSYIEVFQKKIVVGEFSDPVEAALSHDRALIRAIGARQCKEEQLNFTIRRYCKDPIENFAAFDHVLREQLFGTEWKGLQDCDFSFLLVSYPSHVDVNKIRLSKLRHGFVKTNV